MKLIRIRLDFVITAPGIKIPPAINILDLCEPAAEILGADQILSGARYQATILDRPVKPRKPKP